MRHGVLRARLLPPRLPSACLPRTELVERVVDGLAGRLVAVLAGAGYGKSTLAAQVLERAGVPWVWCSCDARLSDHGLLLAHLAAGLAERFPGFGSRLSLDGSAVDLVAELANEVAETISDDFVLAVDDVHVLAGGGRDVIAGLVSALTPNVHLLLAGRSPLPFPLAGLRAGRALEIGERELALSEDEAGELVRSAGFELDADALGRLYRRTEGWVAGLLLAAQSGSDVGGDRVGHAEFEFLAEEVLARQPPEVQEFLLATSVLERFTPDLAAAVSGSSEAAAIPGRLAAGHLFTIRLDDDGTWYRYHHLFGAFLRRRLQEERPGAVAELHRRAAAAWRAAGEPSEAVPHLLRAGDPAGAVDVLDPLADGMVGTPQAESLGHWLDAIPRELWADRPSLILAEAALLLARARHEDSFAAFERAIDELLERGDHERAASALVRMLESMVTAGTRPARRAEIAERHLARIDPAARALPVARVLLASSYAYACRFAEAEAELSAALAAPAAASSLLETYAAIVQAYYIDYQLGAGEKALLQLEEATAELERRGDEDVLTYLPYARMFRLYLLNDLGRFADALTEAARTEEVFGRRGFGRTPARVLAWIRLVALAGLGRWAELEAQFLPPPRAPARDATAYSYRYRSPAALLAAERGDAAAVRAHVAAARAEMRQFGLAFDNPMVMCDLAVAASETGHAVEARELAGEAREIARSMPSPWFEAMACLVGALAEGPGPRGDELLAAAIELTALHGLDSLWTRRQRRQAGRLVARALTVGVGPPGQAARLASACGGEVLGECAELLSFAPPAVRAQLAEAAGSAANPAPDVLDRLLRDPAPVVRAAARRARSRRDARPRPVIDIVSLGRLTVSRDDVPLSDAAFGRQRARALLAALLAAEGPVHREALLEWFWPRLAPTRGAAALNVTLYELRRALQPELEARAAASLVVAEGETVRLVLGERDGWDVARFRSLAARRPGEERADALVARLSDAEAAYGGAFLAEWPYEPWAAGPRARLEEIHLDVLERLAEALAGCGRLYEAIGRYRQLLTLDREREGWHRALMRLYARAGEHALALRQYHACRAVLRRTQGIDPGPETRSVYTELLRETAGG